MSEEPIYLKHMIVKPFGIPIAQKWVHIGDLFSMIDRFSISLVIELGIEYGGLSELLYLRQQRVPGFRYLGFEIIEKKIDPRVKATMPIVIGDIFSSDIKARIADEIKKETGHVLVYCDDGNKPWEMRTYAPIIRSGDYLLVHDYPGETTQASLDEFGKLFPDMKEIEIEEHHSILTSLWRKE